jgi:hypothetical protein
LRGKAHGKKKKKQKFVLILHELLMTEASLSMLELATEFLSFEP